MHQLFTYAPHRHYFDYNWYNLELLRLLGSTPYGGCDAAEFMEAVGLLKPNDAVSWQHQFQSLAERTEALAEEMHKGGHISAARGAYLRACNYFRCAQYLYPNAAASERAYLLSVYERSVASFEQATKLMEHEVRRVQIPFHPPELGETPVKMPGWLHLPTESGQRLVRGRKTPVLICIGGADSTQEELYLMQGAEAPDLGYAFLTFDGPGQGMVLRRDGMRLRPDGEIVVDAVLDFLESYARENPETNLDLDALAVTGQSLGGYLALRGAADPRVKACVAVDPVYDLWDFAMSKMPKWVMWPWERSYMGDWFVDFAVEKHGNLDVATKYTFAQAQDMLGSVNPGQVLRDFKPYTFRLHRTRTARKHKQLQGAQGGVQSATNNYLERVRCPVLVTGAAADPKLFLAEEFTGEIMKHLVNVEKDQKELWIPKAWSEGGAQAKSGAWPLLQYRTYRFLDDKFGIERTPQENGFHVIS